MYKIIWVNSKSSEKLKVKSKKEKFVIRNS